MISKLNWSYDCPAFEEVEGKMALVDNGEDGIYFLYGSEWPELYTDWFGKSFIRYAIIDTAEEMLPLMGTIPEIDRTLGREFRIDWPTDIENKSAVCHGEYHIFIGATREEAIRNWNEFVRKIK